MSAVAAGIAFIALVLAIYASSRAAKQLRHIQKYEKCMDEFIENVQPLLEDEETPEQLVDMIIFMRTKVVDSWAAADFLRHLLSKDRYILRKAGLGEEIDSFLNRRPELASALKRAASAALLAMSYRGHVVGGFLRSLVLFDAREHDGRAADLAAHYKEVDRSHQKSVTAAA
jgi:hypothetical protein